MDHPLQCQCGAVKGLVRDPHSANHAICYCKDCQAFAHFLGRPQEILDERGGSEILQVAPKSVAFTQGMERIACIRLTEKGLVRWYASCCKTPIGNTLITPKLPFIGLLHSCLVRPLDDFGPIRVWVNTQSAKGEPKPKVAGLWTAGRWFFRTVLKARFNGDYKKNPLFRTETGKPIATPRVLTAEEHENVMNAVKAATG